MPVWGGIDIPPGAWQAISNAAEKHSVPVGLLLAIAHSENGTFECARQSEAYKPFYLPFPPGCSAWDRATGRELSYGLFQLNVCGVGYGYDVSTLQDCNANADIAAAHIAGKLAENNNDARVAILAWSTWPVALAKWAIYGNVVTDDTGQNVAPIYNNPDLPFGADGPGVIPDETPDISFGIPGFDDAKIFAVKAGVALVGLLFIAGALALIGRGKLT